MAQSAVTDVSSWLGSIQPGRQAADWPPVTRHLEADADVAAAVDDLFEAIDTFTVGDPSLGEILSDGDANDSLRRVLVQLGSARLLRLTSTLTDRLAPERIGEVLGALRNPRTVEGRAINAALDANARITLRGRLVAQDRLDTLRNALNDEKETSE